MNRSYHSDTVKVTQCDCPLSTHKSGSNLQISGDIGSTVHDQSYNFRSPQRVSNATPCSSQIDIVSKSIQCMGSIPLLVANNNSDSGVDLCYDNFSSSPGNCLDGFEGASGLSLSTSPTSHWGVYVGTKDSKLEVENNAEGDVGLDRECIFTCDSDLEFSQNTSHMVSVPLEDHRNNNASTKCTLGNTFQEKDAINVEVLDSETENTAIYSSSNKCIASGLCCTGNGNEGEEYILSTENTSHNNVSNACLNSGNNNTFQCARNEIKELNNLSSKVCENIELPCDNFHKMGGELADDDSLHKMDRTCHLNNCETVPNISERTDDARTCLVTNQNRSRNGSNNVSKLKKKKSNSKCTCVHYKSGKTSTSTCVIHNHQALDKERHEEVFATSTGTSKFILHEICGM